MKLKIIYFTIAITICSSFKPIEWNILGIPKSNIPIAPIQKIEIINVQWSNGQEEIVTHIETITILTKNKNLQIAKDSIFTNYQIKNISKDTLINFKHTSNEQKCRTIINQIQSQPKPLQVKYKDTLHKINIKSEPNMMSMGGCHQTHGTQHSIKITLFTKDNKKIFIYYQPEQCNPKGPIIGSKYQSNDIYEITNWIYMYKLVNTLIPNHNITNFYFNNSKLEEIINNCSK